jgi:YegS/Rv2252/BmrU family lipid kinase
MNDSHRRSVSRGATLIVIHNLSAGWRRRRRLEAVLGRLAARGQASEVRATLAPGHATHLARQAASEGIDRLVVAGGDGTINEAMQGLAGTDVALAIVPMGTANVLAAEIGLPSDPEAIARTILAGRVHGVSVGRANDRRFALMVGVGFDAEVVARVSPTLKRHLGKAVYGMEAVRAALRGATRSYDIKIDGAAHRAASVIVAKGHFYGGKFVIAPRARLTEPCLWVALFERDDPAAIAGYAAALALGRLDRAKGVRLLPARQVRIDGPAGELFQGDGDIIGTLPVEIGVERDALRLVVPATSPILA